MSSNNPLRKPAADIVGSGGGGFDGSLGSDPLSFGPAPDYKFVYNPDNDRLEILDDTDDKIIASFTKDESLLVPNKLQISDESSSPFIYSLTDNFTDDESTLVISNDETISANNTVAVVPGSFDGKSVEPGDDSTLIGTDIRGNNNGDNVLIGGGLTAAGSGAVGVGCEITGSNVVCVGISSKAGGSNQIVVGHEANGFGKDNSILLGNGVVAADNVCRIGNDNGTHVEFRSSISQGVFDGTWHRQFDKNTGSKVYRRSTVSSNITTSGEEVLSVDSSGGARTVTLASNDAVDGKKTMIKRNGANGVTIDTEGSETIDGGNSFSLGSDDASVTLVYNPDNSDWEVF